MPRRAAAGARPIDADALHGSKLVQQLINKVMIDGKKSTAEQIVYQALNSVAQKSGEEPVVALENSIKILTPVLEVRSRRVGGATYQVPVEVPAPRARTLAVRWLVEFSRRRREKSMSERLAGELMDAQSQQGLAYKRKDDIFRMAQANKAFAHYRWFVVGRARPVEGPDPGPGLTFTATGPERFGEAHDPCPRRLVVFVGPVRYPTRPTAAHPVKPFAH